MEVHELWKKGGEERDKLSHILEKCNWDKAGIPTVLFYRRP
jgi:hypothetical protein